MALDLGHAVRLGTLPTHLGAVPVLLIVDGDLIGRIVVGHRVPNLLVNAYHLISIVASLRALHRVRGRTTLFWRAVLVRLEGASSFLDVGSQALIARR